MTKTGTIICCLMAMCVASGETAFAQYPYGRNLSNRPRQVNRPKTSPYLDLLNRNGRGFGYNYYRNVRPELEFRRANEEIRRSVEQLRPQIAAGARQPLRTRLGTTGHPTSFLNYSNYFGGSRRF